MNFVLSFAQLGLQVTIFGDLGIEGVLVIVQTPLKFISLTLDISLKQILPLLVFK
jgi:hypothetical protein